MRMWRVYGCILAAMCCLAAVSRAEGNVALRVTVEMASPSDKAEISVRGGHASGLKTAASGAPVEFTVAPGSVTLLVKSPGYEDVTMKVDVGASGKTEKVVMRLQPRVTIAAPKGTRVLLGGKDLGTCAGSPDFTIGPPTLVADRAYVLTLKGSAGEKTIRFWARRGNGLIRYGSAHASRGFSTGSKDYHIFPPPTP